MKRFITMLVAGGVAWWSWGRAFEDPEGDGFGFQTCPDGEGVCSNDVGVFFLMLAIVAGIVAFVAFVSTIRLIKRTLRGEDATSDAAREAKLRWVDSPSAPSWTDQVTTTIQQGISMAQQAQAQVQAQARPPVAAPPQQPAAAPPVQAAPGAPGGSARTPSAADRAASRERWLRRAADAGPAMPEVPEIPDLPDLEVPEVPRTRSSRSSSALTGVHSSRAAKERAAAAGAAPHPDTATLVLTDVGPRDLGVQREVRRLTGFGLTDAKDLLAKVDRDPQVIVADLPWDEAQEAKRTLERMGASIDLR